jgi:hypothetical protein
VCASEGGTCECDGSVQYGADGRFSKMVDAGTTNKVVCNTKTFGGDPARNVLKQCYCSTGLRVGKGSTLGSSGERSKAGLAGGIAGGFVLLLLAVVLLGVYSYAGGGDASGAAAAVGDDEEPEALSHDPHTGIFNPTYEGLPDEQQAPGASSTTDGVVSLEDGYLAITANSEDTKEISDSTAGAEQFGGFEDLTKNVTL